MTWERERECSVRESWKRKGFDFLKKLFDKNCICVIYLKNESYYELRDFGSTIKYY
jgi:hypothetical protein